MFSMLLRIDEVSTGQFHQSWTQCLISRSNIYVEEYPTRLGGGDVEEYLTLSWGKVEEYPTQLWREYLDECNIWMDEI